MPEGSPPTPALGTAMFTLANVVTLLRLCAVPVAVWLVLRGQFLAAFWLFAAAGLSDALDGWLARRNGPTRLDWEGLHTMLVTAVAVSTLASLGAYVWQVARGR